MRPQRPARLLLALAPFALLLACDSREKELSRQIDLGKKDEKKAEEKKK